MNDNKTPINMEIPSELNWKLKEEAAKRKVTKKDLVILILQENLE